MGPENGPLVVSLGGKLPFLLSHMSGSASKFLVRALDGQAGDMAEGPMLTTLQVWLSAPMPHSYELLPSSGHHGHHTQVAYTLMK